MPPCSSVVRKNADITDGEPHKVYRIRKKVDITDGVPHKVYCIRKKADITDGVSTDCLNLSQQIWNSDMKIDFRQIDESILPNFKGGERELAVNMFFDDTNRILKGRLVPGATIGMHTHDDSCEVIFILEGKGTMVEIDPESNEEVALPVSEGDCLYCQKGNSHSLRNTSEEGDLVFYAVVPKQ